MQLGRHAAALWRAAVRMLCCWLSCALPLQPGTVVLTLLSCCSWEEAFKKDEGMAWGLVCTISAGTAAANKAAAEEAPMERPVFG
jgi:hypothetical protein